MKQNGSLIENGWWRAGIFLLVAVVVMLIFPSEGSIMFPQMNFDYSVFIVMRDSWLRGAIPYAEVFDHKGPLLYVIQLAGELLGGGKLGVWLLGVVSAVVSFELMYRCGRILGATARANVCALLLGVCGYAIFLDGGNTVEQWSLPAELLPLYMVLRYFRRGAEGPLWRVALVSGLCFGCVAMLRVNNNCIIAGLVAAVGIWLLREKRYGLLWRSMLWFLCGLALVVVPFVVYFHAVGALNDMIYANLTFNIAYMRVWSKLCGGMTVEKYFWNLLCLSPCLVTIYVAWRYGKKEGLRYFLVTALPAALTFAVFIHGEPYRHYFMMAVPWIVLSVQMALCGGYRRYRRIVACVGILAMAAVLFSGQAHVRGLLYKCRAVDEWGGARLERVVKEYIPENELDSVYAYGTFVPATTLNRLGHTPTGKYFYLQMYHYRVSEEAACDIREQFLSARPRWILSDVAYDAEGLPEYAIGYEEIEEARIQTSLLCVGRLYRRK